MTAWHPNTEAFIQFTAAYNRAWLGASLEIRNLKTNFKVPYQKEEKSQIQFPLILNIELDVAASVEL